MVTCSGCGAELRPGLKFCSKCGTAVELRCSACGATLDPGDRFCGECGAGVTENGKPASAAADAAPVSERRLVSVLFADLVGFTTFSEHRDPEEVRELLSGYFDRCRTLIERYGGTVEKFIGDAVMAAWGTPVAREDDAERAVRAALSLTQAVAAMATELDVPELQVRAGVLTGNAAVQVGSQGEGMVMGDSVNTASRLQAIAAPGTVLVDDVTRRASEAAIVYEDAGEHDLKGREEPVRAWTALRVVAGAGGARRGVGLEVPFVGRARELQTIIDAAEESAHEGKARHVTIVGEAGSGKSRLLWEYFKYLDGIEQIRWWHQGRCLSYGQGVAYWALAEMVRSRAGISEEESPESAYEKLRAAVNEHVPDERERRLVEPRLAHLLRLEERPDADRADLFSGWRLFFERMAATSPVTLAFEDLQWADSGLLDFIDYLLEWSAEYPIFVLALGRNELLERRPGWEPLALEPLEPLEITAILDGLVPGLPEDLVGDIARRSEGIPLYAVETVRMLQDRGLLAQEGARYVVAGDVSDLDVPETLHALVASRLDGLSVDERSLLQDASVLGQAFAPAAVAELSGRAEADVTSLLDGLVAKQVLARDDDPRSPERGQYVFLQALLRTVAYGTLARRTRRERHLAAARYLEESWPGELADIAEVLSSHYLEAIRADPDAEDVAELRASARETLTAAGRAAASLALGPEAERYFQQAAELAEDDVERAALAELAGRALAQSGEAEAAEARLREAIDLYRRAGRASGGPAAVHLAANLRRGGRLEEARTTIEEFAAAEDPTVDKVVRAEAQVERASSLSMSGALDEARPLFEEALTALEEEQAWPALASALIGLGIHRTFEHRVQEAGGILRLSLRLAQEHDLPAVAVRVHYNLAAVEMENDRLAESLDEVNAGLAVARERGDRAWERLLVMQSVVPLLALGRWDEAEPLATPLLEGEQDAQALFAASVLAQIAAARGDDEMFQRCRSIADRDWDPTFLDLRAAADLLLARDRLEGGAPGEALTLARPVVDSQATSAEAVAEASALCVEAAQQLPDDAAIEELISFVSGLPPVRATPQLRAGRARLEAELAHRRGDGDAARAREDEAIALLRSLGTRPLLAQALSERARRREDSEALAEAREIYTELGATRRLARLDDVSSVPA